MKVIQNNLKHNCCSATVSGFSVRAKYIKLYDKKIDACLENGNYDWYLLSNILKLNHKSARPTGIVCHKCLDNDKCIISLRINKSQHTRFCVFNKIDFK